MVWRTIRSQAVAALLAATCLAAPAFAHAPAPALQSAPPANRLALVIGEAGYVGAPLQTAANDAALVAKTLGRAPSSVTTRTCDEVCAKSLMTLVMLSEMAGTSDAVPICASTGKR